jgi:hypothetical protein
MGAVMINSSSGVNMNRIVELAKELDAEVMTLSPEEIEEIEDRRTAHRILEGLASGLADRDEMYREFGLL